jgi:hypothetical protein
MAAQVETITPSAFSVPLRQNASHHFWAGDSSVAKWRWVRYMALQEAQPCEQPRNDCH